ncbi:terminase small subunit [Paracoccus phage ParKuw1]|uniref:Terminase small subunit n=1 Tax=Paracoccus phage ParKuw1 TaxID=3032415 RepID=A0AAF0FJS0_9CAUD|nr:terminase small subunit [Paracoccus phage ParKuw1]
MATGAAKESQLGGLHSMLTRVFQKVLDKYERDLDRIEEMSADELGEEMADMLSEPNPAMLSAIAKFLKDNDIGMDSEAVDELNATQRRLADRREARKRAGINLSVVPAVGEH